MILLWISLPSILSQLRSRSEIAVIAGLLGLWLLYKTGWEKWRKYRSRGWPTSEGTIAELKLRKVDGGLNGVDYWKIGFNYRYRVAQEHVGSYSFNCATEAMADGAIAGLTGKTVSVHYKPSDEGKGLLWEDEVWDIWWDTYWQMSHEDAAAKIE